MAVEARHLNLFPTQIINGNSRGEMMMNSGGVVSSNACHNFYGGVFSSTAVVVPTSASNDAVPVKNVPLQSDSGLTNAAAVPAASRKRAREFVLSSNHQMTSLPILNVSPNHHDDAIANNRCGGGDGSFTFLGEDVSPYLLLQQCSDVDRFVAHYTEKVRLEVQQRRNRYSQGIAATFEESVMKKLKVKEEEIGRIGKLNCMLEERVKSLSMENQIWRELAQSNEATANALRSDLEQVLADHQLQVQQQQPPEIFADDAQSCCGSNYNAGEERSDELPKSNSINRMCRSCGREESCVLILPCRHLCVCSACSSRVHACPVCSSTKTRSLHVNLFS